MKPVVTPLFLMSRLWPSLLLAAEGTVVSEPSRSPPSRCRSLAARKRATGGNTELSTEPSRSSPPLLPKKLLAAYLALWLVTFRTSGLFGCSPRTAFRLMRAKVPEASLTGAKHRDSVCDGLSAKCWLQDPPRKLQPLSIQGHN